MKIIIIYLDKRGLERQKILDELYELKTRYRLKMYFVSKGCIQPKELYTTTKVVYNRCG